MNLFFHRILILINRVKFEIDCEHYPEKYSTLISRIALVIADGFANTFKLSKLINHFLISS